ncbi:hypothetical protein HPTD01_370 [Halomonas sp. TD01]|nr:hypothetical protein HPTD01_370 [Halomonas sp. TD01]
MNIQLIMHFFRTLGHHNHITSKRLLNFPIRNEGLTLNDAQSFDRKYGVSEPG